MSKYFKSFNYKSEFDHKEYTIELIPSWEWTEHYGNELDCYDNLSKENSELMYKGYTRRLQFYEEDDKYKGSYYAWFSDDGGETGYRAGYVFDRDGCIEVDVRLDMMSCGIKFKKEKTLEEAAGHLVDTHLSWMKEEEEKRKSLTKDS